MIRERLGDIFSVQQQAVAHGVNLKGVMGSGIAKTVRERYPEVDEAYRKAAKSGELEAGGCLPVVSHDGTLILNLATQIKTGSNASLELIEKSLPLMYDFLEENGYTEVALPQIGSGIGGLNWGRVRNLIITEAQKHPSIVTDLWTFA